MSARFLRIMNVILMPCVLTLMARIFVGVHEATKEMAEYALVRPKVPIVCFVPQFMTAKSHS